MPPDAPPPLASPDAEPPRASDVVGGDAVTAMLRAASGGDRQVLDALLPHVYAELKRLARAARAGRAGETLCTTALVHEAYLKLVPSAGTDWQGRAHFFGVAARAMRQLLVDAARARAREKRGGGDWAVTFDEAAHAAPARAEEVLALDAALDRLAALDARQARVVEHRFFGGLTAAETAEVLGVSVPTVDRDWRAARAWLRREMRAS
jgi:RNA polymerase sigma factor (TIGR02999 family)